MTYKMTYKDGKNVRDHVLIAEEKIGRKLKKNEVAHHMDGDKRNNNPENLTVVTRSEHAKIHARDRGGNPRFPRTVVLVPQPLQKKRPCRR